MYVKSVEIRKLWNRVDVELDFDTDINIIIGRNGSGKTTVINLIKATLLAEIELLNAIPFESVHILLREGSTQRKVSVSRDTSTKPIPAFVFKISNKPFIIPIEIFRRSLGRIRKRVPSLMYPPNLPSIYDDLLSSLNEIAKVRWLSVSRYPMIKDEFERDEGLESAVDIKLSQLQEEFSRYLLVLETRESRLLSEFQQNVFKDLLYNPKLDAFDEKSFINFNFREEKRSLINAFKELGVPLDEATPLVNRHIKRLKESVKNIKASLKKDEQERTFYLNDVLALPLVTRTREITRMIRDLEENRMKINQQLNRFITYLNNFTEDKEFHIEKGQIGVRLREDGEEISVYKLSSGEKQLVILLMEALVQDNMPCIYLADEPELSLHVIWQEKVLSAMREMNEKAQIIVATHSPDIVGDFGRSVIDISERTKQG